ncbi:hypothetical protein [Caballeronia sp. GACF4]|uniref:hypothetical protein n=1 Tax=Caballeronia sp. GACF4 TaxID=2921763 RepID=UPI00202893F7|nr:hypothetical protein [Caballeronia sp. GACF4]
MMNDLPPPLIGQSKSHMPIASRIMSALLIMLVFVLLLVAITATSWAILYLIRTAS